ncbi:MAG: cupredoxin family protein [Pseudomonadota bacterium]|nr:cupredoxin family protein [Pseudomonadota bacterium]
MKTQMTALAFLLAVTGGAAAAGSHAGGHGEAGKMHIGKPGDASRSWRTVTVTMMENSDGGMLFKPASLKVKEGETLRLKFVNKGELEHEFVMDVHEGIMEHKALMERFPEMEHDDPNAIRLAPGASGEIVWTFANAGDFGFACLIPGHYDSGMKGDIVVAQ